MDSLVVTTAIPFVNAAPHLGHALELVETDVLARHARLRGHAVYLLTGTDEHAAKNARAASASGQPVERFVARNAARFRELADALDVSYDDFIRTSADPRHAPFVEELWNRCAARGDLFRAAYAGTYCAGCEEFRDDPCPEHDAPLEVVEEENWFFRLGRYADQVRDLVAGGRLRIEPVERRNEVLGFLSGDVRDLSVSRPRARVHGWGLPVPNDPDQLVYVWFDALANYVSAPGETRWTNAGRRRHVVGKGILRFHAVIWPAILLSAGITLPDELFVHDYVTVDGRKIGKSLGNAVDPVDLVDRYGVSALRWWLAREVPRVGDGDFSEARLVAAADRDLANAFGNLVQRLSALAGGRVRDSYDPSLVRELPARVDAALERFDLRGATEAIVGAVDATNREIERLRPWERRGSDRDELLVPLLGAARLIAGELEPFVPEVAAVARARLESPGAGPPVFARLAARG